MELETMGWISLIPAIIAIVLSFATKNTIVALITACLVGTLCAGQGIMGLPTLIKEATGTTSFSWVMLLNLYIAVIVAFFTRPDPFRRSLTAYKGYLTHQETSGIQGKPWVPPEVILGIADRKLDPAPQATVTVSENYYPEFAGQI